jgi:hypothetical protein
MDDGLRATLAVIAILDSLDVPYLIGGSLASSLHGVPRSTRDADLAVDLQPERVGPLVAALAGAFYVDEGAARSAVARRASFNAIHLPTMFKVDLFVLGDDALARSELARREVHGVGDPPVDVFVASPEDTVLQKLLWYRLGNRVSDRQWDDLVGVLRVQGERLDRGYVEGWAGELGLSDLLREAVEAAAGGQEPSPQET